MTEQFDEIISRISFPQFCIFIPGLLITFGGLRSLLRKKIINIGTSTDFRWKKPEFLEGRDAIKAGGCFLLFGLFLLLFGSILLLLEF